jgi:hypothetical protein
VPILIELFDTADADRQSCDQGATPLTHRTEGSGADRHGRQPFEMKLPNFLGEYYKRMIEGSDTGLFV